MQRCPQNVRMPMSVEGRGRLQTLSALSGLMNVAGVPGTNICLWAGATLEAPIRRPENARRPVNAVSGGEDGRGRRLALMARRPCSEHDTAGGPRGCLRFSHALSGCPRVAEPDHLNPLRLGCPGQVGDRGDRRGSRAMADMPSGCGGDACSDVPRHLPDQGLRPSPVTIRVPRLTVGGGELRISPTRITVCSPHTST